LQDQFGGFKLVGKDSMLLRVASILGRGSLNAGTFVAQVFHWFYVNVGRPRATTSYRACVNVLLSSEKVHLNLLRKMTEAHSLLTIFNACKHRSQVESTQNYHVTSLDQLSIRARLPAVA
jgi:hypothetical protein